MSLNNDIKTARKWMYERIDGSTNQVSETFCQGLESFMEFAKSQPLFLENGKLFCPCYKCDNGRLLEEKTVWSHLFNRGFTCNYWVWISHGENYNILNNPENITASTEDASGFDSQTETVNPYVSMVSDAYADSNKETSFDENMEEEPNDEAKRFYNILDAAKHPIYDGCKEGLSQLSLAARLMSLKTDYNLPQNCMDSISQMMQEYLPQGNNSMNSYYDIKKLMRSLGLPYQKIDVCQDNCMLFWKDSANLENCLFCKKDRYRPTQKSGKKKVAYNQMFYLPVGDRLKRLYQSNNTARDMRWHAEHSMNGGEMCHPSDGEAWKHFCEVYPEFASESRNIYLGLCTDGFNPFGMSGHNYSLWPVILTPYNMPPEMCMKQEFLFLTILVPGPNHPKRSLDIFLQPLI